MKTYIGIDPAFRQDGFAMCYLEPSTKANASESEYQVRFVAFKRYLDFINWCFDYIRTRDTKAEHDLVFCVENSNLQNCTFDPTGGLKRANRKSRNVGTNQAASQICVDALREYAPLATMIEISPLKKSVKLTQQEYDASVEVYQFAVVGKNKLSKKPTSKDKRDAYKLALYAKNLLGMESKIKPSPFQKPNPNKL